MTSKFQADEARVDAAAAGLQAAAAQPAATAPAVLATINQGPGGVVVAAGASGVVVGPTPALLNNTNGRLLVLYSTSGAPGAGFTGMDLQLQFSIDGGAFNPAGSDIQVSAPASEKVAGSSFLAAQFVSAFGSHTIAFQVVASPTGGSYTSGTPAEGTIIVMQIAGA